MVPTGWAGEVKALLLIHPLHARLKTEAPARSNPLRNAQGGVFSVSCQPGGAGELPPGQNRDKGAGAVEPVVMIKME